MSAEGYIRFECEWVRAEPVKFAGFEMLNAARQRARELGLIGVYPNGIGFGNISLRAEDGADFFISGSATGDLERLSESHYARVTGFDFARNRVRCIGPIKASAESMTHAAIYQADPTVKAVIHGHHRALWEASLDTEATTAAAVEYGTPEMAGEILRLFREENAAERKFIAMAGHEEGLLAFGPALAAVLGEYEERLNSSSSQRFAPRAHASPILRDSPRTI